MRNIHKTEIFYVLENSARQRPQTEEQQVNETYNCLSSHTWTVPLGCGAGKGNSGDYWFLGVKYGDWVFKEACRVKFIRKSIKKERESERALWQHAEAWLLSLQMNMDQSMYMKQLLNAGERTISKKQAIRIMTIWYTDC